MEGRGRNCRWWQHLVHFTCFLPSLPPIRSTSLHFTSLFSIPTKQRNRKCDKSRMQFALETLILPESKNNNHNNPCWKKRKMESKRKRRHRRQQDAYFCGKNQKTFPGKSPRLRFHFSFSQQQLAATFLVIFLLLLLLPPICCRK